MSRFRLFPAVIAGLVCASLLGTASADAGTLTRIAGTGVTGFSGDGGAASAAQVSSIAGIAVDSSGAVIFADTYNGRIRRIASNGVITTVAGNGRGNSSASGVPATSVPLDDPFGVAVDTAGNIYFTEDLHIRKVSAAGVISTIGGNGLSVGSNNPVLDGSIAVDSPMTPRGVAIDKAGRVIFTDIYDHRVRAIASDGRLQTVAGDGTWGSSGGGDGGPATAAQIATSDGLAVGPDGSIYIGSMVTNDGTLVGTSIRRVTPDGLISTAVPASQIYHVESIAVGDDGSLWWMDRTDASAQPSTLVRRGADGAVSSQTLLYYSYGVALRTNDAVVGSWISGEGIYSVSGLASGLDTPVPDGSFAYWPLDEATGSASVTDRVSALDGTVDGAQTGAAGVSGRSIVLGPATGVDLTSYASALSPANNFTFEAWLKKPAGPALNGFVAGWRKGGWRLSLKNDHLKLDVNTTGGQQAVQSKTVVGSAGWHHIAVVKSDTAVRLYIDGRPDTEGSADPALVSEPFPTS